MGHKTEIDKQLGFLLEKLIGDSQTSLCNSIVPIV